MTCSLIEPSILSKLGTGVTCEAKSNIFTITLGEEPSIDPLAEQITFTEGSVNDTDGNPISNIQPIYTIDTNTMPTITSISTDKATYNYGDDIIISISSSSGSSTFMNCVIEYSINSIDPEYNPMAQ